MYKLIGPFSQVLSFEKEPLNGPLKDDQLSIIWHAGILVCEGMILKLGSFKDLVTSLAAGKEPYEIEEIKGEAVAMPGFVDAHTHICHGGSRAADYAKRNAGISYLEIAREGGGIWDTVVQTRSMSQDALADITLSRVRKLVEKGMTTVEIKSGYGLSVAEELKMLLSIKSVIAQSPIDIVPTCLAAHIIPKNYYGGAAKYLQDIIEQIFPVMRDEKLAHRVDAFVEQEAYQSKELQAYLSAAKKFGFDITLHADQFSPIGVPLAIEYGAVSADHLEAIHETSIRAIAHSQTVALVLPGASMGLGCSFAPARKLLDAGACVAIASDWNPGSAPMGDLLCQAAVLGCFEKLSTAEILGGITYRAAHALRLADRGRLLSGMLADIVVFQTNDYREILYRQGQLQPVQVIKRGRTIFSSLQA